MDLHKIVAELREEQERLTEAIVALERIARSGGKRRGRPPAWLKEAKASKPGRKRSSESEPSPEQ